MNEEADESEGFDFQGVPRVETRKVSLLEDRPFALCLTHDVDRPYRTYQPVYEAVTRRRARDFRRVLSRENTFWQFEHVMEMEAELGVRSAFYFLHERSLFRDLPVHEWIRPEAWKLYAGRYSVDDPAVADAITALDEGGWEVGLHGSYTSFRDRDRLQLEKQTLETVLGHPVVGGRQHYLNLAVPETWRIQSTLGLQYDASLGSSSRYGFQYGYAPLRPFCDSFVVFPTTLMELTLPGVGSDTQRAWRVCERLLDEAREHHAVMTVLWHPRYFSERDHPGYASLYRRLVERALEMGAWVGPPAKLYDALPEVDTRRPLSEPTSDIELS